MSNWQTTTISREEKTYRCLKNKKELKFANWHCYSQARFKTEFPKISHLLLHVYLRYVGSKIPPYIPTKPNLGRRMRLHQSNTQFKLCQVEFQRWRLARTHTAVNEIAIRFNVRARSLPTF